MKTIMFSIAYFILTFRSLTWDVWSLRVIPHTPPSKGDFCKVLSNEFSSRSSIEFDPKKKFLEWGGFYCLNKSETSTTEWACLFLEFLFRFASSQNEHHILWSFKNATLTHFYFKVRLFSLLSPSFITTTLHPFQEGNFRAKIKGSKTVSWWICG